MEIKFPEKNVPEYNAINIIEMNGISEFAGNKFKIGALINSKN